MNLLSSDVEINTFEKFIIGLCLIFINKIRVDYFDPWK